MCPNVADHRFAEHETQKLIYKQHIHQPPFSCHACSSPHEKYLHQERKNLHARSLKALLHAILVTYS